MNNLNTCLFNGAIETAREILDNGVDINAKGDNENYPIFAAINSGYPEVLRFVITYGANVNVCDDNGWTPLHIAFDNAIDGMIQNNLEKPNQEEISMIKLLLDNGANPNNPDLSGETALDSLNTYAPNIDRFNFLKDIFRSIHPSIDNDITFRKNH